MTDFFEISFCMGNSVRYLYFFLRFLLIGICCFCFCFDIVFLDYIEYKPDITDNLYSRRYGFFFELKIFREKCRIIIPEIKGMFFERISFEIFNGFNFFFFVALIHNIISDNPSCS